MKSLLTIFTLVFTVMFSSTSYAEWTKVSESDKGYTVYVDFERIRKHDGYVYSWNLVDYLKPDALGRLSSQIYRQVDCGIFRYKNLSLIGHMQQMGGDTGESTNPKNPEWNYVPPNSVMNTVLKVVCSQ